jgi:hypothetical protein
MARYQLPKAQSMYRDTGLVENTQLFRDRYVQNMAANDSLAQSVLEMSSIEWSKKDQEAKAALVDKYNAQLTQRSESGNLHMLGSAIQKDARSFINEYQPLKVSKESYDNWAKGLAESRDQFTKTGKGVDPETFNAKMAEARYNYKGVQKNANGSVDETSLFSGPSYVGYVNIEKEIIDNMKDVVMQSFDTTGVENPYDANMQIIKGFNETTQSPAYYITDGKREEWIDTNIVAQVVTSVLNQPGPSAYINQNSHLQNYTKNEIDPTTNLSIASGEIDERLAELGETIDKLESKKKLTKEEEHTLEATLSLEEKVEEARSNGTDDVALLNYLDTVTQRADYMDAAITKYAGVKSQEYVRNITEGSSLKGSNSGTGGTLPTIKYNVGVDGLVVEPLGGNSLNSKQEAYTSSLDAIENYVTENGEEFVELALSATTAEQYDEIAKAYGISNPEARRMSKEIKHHKTMSELIALKLEEAFMSEHSMSSEDYGNSIDNGASELNASYSGINYLEEQNFTLDMSAIQSALGELGKTGMGPGEMISALNDDKKLKNQVVKIIATQNMNSANMEAVDPAVLEIPELVEGIKLDFTQETSQGIDNMISEHMEVVDTGKAKINKFLKDEEIKTDAVVMTSFNDKTGKTTKAIQNFLTEGLPNSDNFQLLDKNGNKTTYKELVESEKDVWIMTDDKAPTIVKEQLGLVHVSRPDGMALIAIPFKNEEGKIETYFADASQLSIESVDKYTNSMSYRLRTLYRAGVHANITTQWSPEFFEGTVTFDYAREKVIIDNVEHGIEDGLLVIENSLKANNQDL